VSIPPFYLASVYLDVFAVNLGVISVAGNTGLARYLPAALCLSVLGIALYALMLSKAMQAEMGEDYAIYLRCRGISEGRILLRHALPRAVIGWCRAYADAGALYGGCCVVESVFSCRGSAI
jgi:peptide/nickel transport system permease protein